MRKILLAAILFLALPAYAQFSIPGAETAVTISMSPAYPGANTPVDLTVQSGLYDLSEALITWTAGGKVIAQGVGATAARVLTGALGTASRVDVDVESVDGTASGSLTIAPATLDLLWESNSYVPPFYRGRALSSAGSAVTVVAIPHLVRSSGTSIPADQLVYTWKKNGALLTAASGKGRSSATFDGPMLYGVDTISVVAASSDGTLSAQALLRINDAAPALMLYEDDPLFGILYHRALPRAISIPETEMSFAAIPYFSPVTRLNDPRLEYVWTVNGKTIALNAQKPNEITIDAARSSGVAAIGLELGHASNFFFGIQGAWDVTFSRGGINAQGTGTVDPFHR